MSKKAVHWADITAEQIVREKGQKKVYTCASGITPSGTVHIGNFREIISVDLVVRALRDQGKNVRFIYSWDDYDVFRKVPQNMPRQEELEKHLRFPITMVPDPWERDESYARHHEVDVEEVLPLVGIEPEYLYQAQQYRRSAYAKEIKTALEKREELVDILNSYRDDEHKIRGPWWPVSVFCSSCNRDTTEILSWNGDWELTYQCSECGHRETVDIRQAQGVKLGWRVDWPMRWAHEGVDFEPAGKDHHSQGGSFDTAKHIARKVYNFEPPISFRYDFIGIKGDPGKMSSSKGKVVDLPDILRVYTPQVVRYLFAGTRPNTEFVISFDLDVIKIYEDYDKTERIAYGLEKAKNPGIYERERRIYELSQVHGMAKQMPYQLAFRHLCNLLQIADGDIEKVLSHLGDVKPEQREDFIARCNCAWYWIRECAPEDFRYHLRVEGDENKLDPREKEVLAQLYNKVVLCLDDFPDDKSLGQELYALAKELEIDSKELFRISYQALVGKDQGPRLAGFLRSIGRERLTAIFALILEKELL